MKLYLRKVREQKDMSLRKLSEKSGVAKSHIERLEAEESNPTLQTICKLAKALQVPVTDLFSCED